MKVKPETAEDCIFALLLVCSIVHVAFCFYKIVHMQ